MTDLNELERLLREATAGPWIEMEGHPYLFANPRGPQPWHHDIVGRFDYHSDANRALIAALRNCAEELIRDARRLQWIDEHATFIDTLADPDNMIRVWHSPGEKSATGKTIREALDAAIAQEQP